MVARIFYISTLHVYNSTDSSTAPIIGKTAFRRRARQIVYPLKMSPPTRQLLFCQWVCIMFLSLFGPTPAIYRSRFKGSPAICVRLKYDGAEFTCVWPGN